MRLAGAGAVIAPSPFGPNMPIVCTALDRAALPGPAVSTTPISRRSASLLSASVVERDDADRVVHREPHAGVRLDARVHPLDEQLAHVPPSGGRAEVRQGAGRELADRRVRVFHLLHHRGDVPAVDRLGHFGSGGLVGSFLSGSFFGSRGRLGVHHGRDEQREEQRERAAERGGAGSANRRGDGRRGGLHESTSVALPRYRLTVSIPAPLAPGQRLPRGRANSTKALAVHSRFAAETATCVVTSTLARSPQSWRPRQVGDTRRPWRCWRPWSSRDHRLTPVRGSARGPFRWPGAAAPPVT